jgi:hypothetical protein
VYKINIAAVYAINKPTSKTQSRSGIHQKGSGRNSPVAPFHGTSGMLLCSNPAAWMPLMSVPHIPSWPTTSYSGDLRTKNSSAALAGVTRPSADGVSNKPRKPH